MDPFNLKPPMQLGGRVGRSSEPLEFWVCFRHPKTPETVNSGSAAKGAFFEKSGGTHHHPLTTTKFLFKRPKAIHIVDPYPWPAEKKNAALLLHRWLGAATYLAAAGHSTALRPFPCCIWAPPFGSGGNTLPSLCCSRYSAGVPLLFLVGPQGNQTFGRPRVLRQTHFEPQSQPVLNHLVPSSSSWKVREAAQKHPKQTCSGQILIFSPYKDCQKGASSWPPSRSFAQTRWTPSRTHLLGDCVFQGSCPMILTCQFGSTSSG